MTPAESHSTTIQHSIPLGGRIPDSPHGVSVSLPTMADVVAYEEKEPRTLAKLRSGYPRFVRHAYIEQLASIFMDEMQLDPGRLQPFFFSSVPAMRDAQYWVQKLAGEVFPQPESYSFHKTAVVLARKGSESELQLTKYLQHTGTGLSSREAEIILKKIGTPPPASEQLGATDELHLQTQLHRWFQPEATCSIHICKSGMNAFYGAFQAINMLQSQIAEKRKNWISVGWLYLDTISILNSYLPEGGICKTFLNTNDTEGIIEFIEENGHSVAGLVLEAPTNPLVQCPDILRISEACQKMGILTIMDPSLVSPQNVDLSSYCDVICCSLTKYACYEGDVMIGATCVNLERKHGQVLSRVLEDLLTAPHGGDLKRLQDCLERAPSVVDDINRNTMQMADHFNAKSSVLKTFWAYEESSAKGYSQLHRSEERPGGVITLQLNRPIEAVYDPLTLPKGPSFGTSFTFVCPYLHLAHYDLMQCQEGRQRLESAGIPLNMLRISIGTEPIDEIRGWFDQVL